MMMKEWLLKGVGVEQTVLNWIFGGLSGVLFTLLGWLGRTLWELVNALKDDVKKIEVALPSHYARRDELDSRFDKVDVMLHRILEKMDKKADKQ